MKEQYRLYGQNNPPLGYHIAAQIPPGTKVPMFEVLCGCKLDFTGRIYVSDSNHIQAICPKCVEIAEANEAKQPPPAAQTVTPPRSWAYRVAEAIAKWIGNAIANVFFGNGRPRA